MLDGENRRLFALRVIGRVHLGEHINGLAHPRHVKSSEMLFFLIGGLHDRELLNRFDDLVNLSGQ